MKLALILLFVYNRPWHTNLTIEALKRNDLASDSELFIFSDGPKNKSDNKKVQEVRNVIKNLSGFKKIKIYERKKNIGLAESVIKGVSQIIRSYKKVLVLEDDLVTSANFLDFMNRALDFYKDDGRIFSIGGFHYPVEIPKAYKYDVYLTYRCNSWGWATWLNRWNKVDWSVKDYNKFKSDQKAQVLFNRGGQDLTKMLENQMNGRIDSWAIRWCYAHYKNRAFCLRPTISKVRNIGLDGSGRHKSVSNLKTVLDNGKKKTHLITNIKINNDINSNYYRHFTASKVSRVRNYSIGLISLAFKRFYNVYGK